MKKVIFCVLAVLVSWTFCSGAKAATIFTDNFESYSEGSLNGRGGWVAVDGFVQTQRVKEGEKAIKLSDYYCVGVTNIKKTGTPQTDGQTTIYFYIADATYGGLNIYLQEENSERVEVRFVGIVPQYFNGTKYVTFPTITHVSNFNWHALQIQWRSSDHKARYNINGGAWTAWAPTRSAWSGGLDTIRIKQRCSGAYIDAIQENLIGYKHPVLIVPGLLGTEMKKGDDSFWLNPIMVNPFNDDSFMDPLGFFDDLTPLDINISPTNVIKFVETNVGGVNIVFYNYIGGLINEFKNQGYAEGVDLFTFPYDWRYGASGVNLDGKTNSDLLGQKIDEILQQTGAQKLDVVAHSLGGLVVKKYVADNAAAGGGSKINKAVFVGVPNTGSPKAAKVLLQGDNFGVIGLNDGEIKKISENMPSAYDLLPSQKYYDAKGSYIKTVTQDVGNLIFEEKDLNYDESKSFLAGSHSLNSLALSNSQNLHTQSFDDFDLRGAGVDVYSINGCKTGTLSKIIEKTRTDIFGNTHVEYLNPELSPGDGTVTLESATNLPVDQNKKYYSLNSDHSKMLSQDGSRQEIVNLISGSSLPAGQNITQDIAQCNLNGRAISVFSPVDIFVEDSFGNKLGLAEDGSIENQIPGADFEIWGDPASPAGRHKFVYVPTDGGQVYTINLQGTGNGTFTIKSQTIQNSAPAETEVFSNLSVTSQLKGQINLAGETATLSLDNNGDGTVDQSTGPDAVLGAEEPEDFLAPVSTALITGQQNAMVAITAQDSGSGVLDVAYSLDGAGLVKTAGATASFTVSSEGKHSVEFFATDRAGNNESPKVAHFTVVKLPQNKDDCKNSGWKNYGGKFKNQGQCVSFVETGKAR